MQQKQPGLLTESSVVDVKSSFHVSRRRDFWGNRNLRKKSFKTFSEFERESFKVSQKISAEPSELRFNYQFQENLFLKCDIFAWFLGRRATRFGHLGRVFYWNYQKIFSTKLCFGSNFSLKKGLHIPIFQQKTFGSIVKTFRERCQNYIPRGQKILLKNNVFRIIYHFLPFGFSALTFWMFSDIFLVGLSKLPFLGLEDTLGWKKFEWKLHNLHVHKRRFLGETSVWNLRFTSTHSKRWKMRVFSEELFGRVVKTESSVSRRYYRRKTFSNIFIIFFFFGLSKIFSDAWAKNLWLKKIPCNIWLWANDVQATAPEETFGGKNIFSKRNFSHQFSTFSSWLSGFWQKTGRVIKAAIYVSRGRFWQETIFEKKIILFGNAA